MSRSEAEGAVPVAPEGLRVAVTLPSLPPPAPQRIALEAALAGLAGRGGVEVEAFAEHDRLREAWGFEAPSGAAGPAAEPARIPWGDHGVPVFHYLRFSERHAEAAFDVALHPLGRDAGSYQSVVGMMRRCPGATWVLEPVLHHMAIGALALHDRLSEYHRILEGCHPRRAHVVRRLVGAGWATSSTFRHFDVREWILRDQPALLFGGVGIAEQLGRDPADPETTVVPLPVPALPQLGRRRDNGEANEAGEAGAGEAGTAGETGDQGPRHPAGSPLRVTFLSANLASPWSLLDAAQALRERFGDRRELLMQACVPAVVYRHSFAAVARERGLDARIDWLTEEDWSEIVGAVAAADVVVGLRPDAPAGERSLLDAALAAGKVVVVADTPVYRDYPDSAVVKMLPGRLGGGVLAGTLARLLDGGRLARHFARARREFAADRPDAEDVARRLLARLTELAASGPLEVRDTAATALEATLSDAAEHCMPPGSGRAVRDEIAALLEDRFAGWQEDVADAHRR